MKITVLIALLLVTINSFAKPILEKFCDLNNGVVEKKITCPKSKITLNVKTCFFENDYGEKQFVDGCSGPSGGHSNLFFNSCVKHDLCYHNEPSSNGYSQKYCDDLFLSNALNDCLLLKEGKAIDRCEYWARSMYQGLRVIGWAAFKCSNTQVNY